MKKTQWVQILYPLLIAEFERHQKPGVRFDSRLLRKLALIILENSMNADSNTYTVNATFGLNKREHINLAWARRYMQINNVVVRAKTGILLIYPSKLDIIHQKLAYHLG